MVDRMAQLDIVVSSDRADLTSAAGHLALDA